MGGKVNLHSNGGRPTSAPPVHLPRLRAGQGRRSIKYSTVGTVKAAVWGAWLPATDGGRMTAVSAVPATLVPPIGPAVDVPATPAGASASNRIGVVVPGAVAATRSRPGAIGV